MSNFTANNIRWIRVTKRNPCPICGKPDWCLVAPDGKNVICARIENDKPAGQAGWLHSLESGTPRVFPQTQTAKQNPKTTIENLDKTYSQLLYELELFERHKDNLAKRGLSESQIESRNYRSMPKDGRDLIIRKLLNHDIQLRGVPGFWTDSFNNWRLSGPYGIAIPIRDLDNRISGMQIRCDDTTSGKYKWLSSADRVNGCSSGVSVHVAKPSKYSPEEVWITEGPLKADISCFKLGRICLAIPGVACWPKAIPIICKLRPKSIVVALDMDKLINNTVNYHRIQLINRLINLGFAVFEANWNSEFKGLDDLLSIGEIK